MRKNASRELTKRQMRRLKSKGERQRDIRRVSDFALLGRWFVFGGGLILSLLVVAAYLTPMLSISKIEVVGVNRVDSAVVIERLSPVLGESLTTVSEAQVTALLEEFALIDTVALESRPPNTLLVRIQERQPIAIVRSSGKDYLYDAAGVRIAEAEDEESLPRLKGVGNPSGSKKFETSIQIILEMPSSLFEDLETLELEESSAVLRVRNHEFDVIWGDSSQGALKAEVLQSILESLDSDPKLVDVSSPLAPVVKY